MTNAVQSENAASLWREDSTRPAGFRRTLKIGRREYGFRWIPAGEFKMGCPESERKAAADASREDGYDFTFSEETPQRDVTLTRGFWMLETLVTQRLFKEIMKENPSVLHKNGDLPAVFVSHKYALKFCRWLTKRLPRGLKATLPTEAQWEYACRAGTTTAYNWGDRWDDDKANVGSHMPTPVAKYAPNAWGLYDMHGNVWEWTLDWIDDYPSCDAVDPTGPERGKYRSIRGGASNSYPCEVRSASRFAEEERWGKHDIGFRVLLTCE